MIDSDGDFVLLGCGLYGQDRLGGDYYSQDDLIYDVSVAIGRRGRRSTFAAVGSVSTEDGISTYYVGLNYNIVKVKRGSLGGSDDLE
jgi:hypothetical protein